MVFAGAFAPVRPNPNANTKLRFVGAVTDARFFFSLHALIASPKSLPAASRLSKGGL